MAVAETGGKFRRQRIILLVTAKPKRKRMVEKTGKTIRGCRDKHQGTYLDGMAHGKFRQQAKLRVTARTNVFRSSCPALRSPSGM